MKTQQITRLAIIGGEIVTAQAGADRAARFTLEWVGCSDGDEMLECRVVPPEEGEDGPFSIYQCWGESAPTRDDGDGDLLAGFATRAEADAFAAAYNAAALAKMADAEWVNLPRAIDHFHFGGCEQGNYPLYHTATLSVSVDGKEISVTGCGDSESGSFAVMADAINKLIKALSN